MLHRLSILVAGSLLMGLAPPIDTALARTVAPTFRYDPSFPKPLPHNWIIGDVKGVTVDADDNVWIVQSATGDAGVYAAEQKPPTADCCVRAPAVLAFNPRGEVIEAWGGQGYVPGWPHLEHTIVVDAEGHVWIGGNAAGDTLLEFTRDGKLLRDWGHRASPSSAKLRDMQQNNQQTDVLALGSVSAVIDDKAHEVFFADGSLNKRIVVYDIDTGAFKRGWGAYGKPLSEIDNVRQAPRKPGEGPRADFTPAIHCITKSRDGLIYVCDRNGNRIQVFTKSGKYIREYVIKPETLGFGSVSSLAFSNDREQTWMYVVDMEDATVWIVERKNGAIVGHIGRKGVEGGNFMEAHVIASDSKGALYIGEGTPYPRLQKFVPVR